MVDALQTAVPMPRDLVRRLGALLTAIAGVMNIVSALYPAIPARMDLLADVLPLTLIRSAQTASVLLGFALILLADGLRKRRARALQITVVLLLLSALFHLTKGLDYEEAMVATGLACALLAVRDSFDVRGRPAAPQHLVSLLARLCVLFYCYVLTGFLILRHAVTPAPTFAGATVEPFRLLADAPLYHYWTPQARWFERSLSCLACFLALYLVARALRPLIPHLPATSTDREHVRALVRRWGTDTLAYFALQDRRSYYFDPTGQAVISYRLWGNVALVGGDPVGPPRLIPGLIRSFLDFAACNGMEPCFLGVSTRTLHLYHGIGLRTLKIGEEAILDLERFAANNLKRKVRRAARHIGELGITAHVYRRDEVPPHIMAQISAISREWVKTRGGGERGFSMTLGRLPSHADRDCELVVAQQGDAVAGYLSLVPVHAGNAWSLDSMRRTADCPNGLMEFLIIRAAEMYRQRGYDRLSLNFATLSNEVGDIDSRALEGTRRFLFEHLSSFYQLKSLYQFNSKFAPVWESRYLAYRDVLKIPKLAVAIAQSEDPIRLPSVGLKLRR